jgi:hypothetical protein
MIWQQARRKETNTKTLGWCKDNIKIDFKETDWGGIYWLHLA